MLAWSNLQIPNLFLCILLFCKFLMYFIVFISYVFLCFYDFLFFVIWSWLISRYTKLCKWPKRQNNIVLEHFKKISNFYVFCTQTYAKCGFWAIFEPTCEYKKSRDLATMVRFSQTWYQKMRKTWKKKVMKRPCRDQRRSRHSRGFCAGGGQIDPPPS